MGQVVASLVLIGCDESVKELSAATGQPLWAESEYIPVTSCVIIEGANGLITLWPRCAISCIIIGSESVEELSAGTGQPFSEEAKDNPVTSRC